MLSGLYPRALFLASALHAASSVAAVHLNALGKRSHVSSLSNTGNVEYTTNITLNGAAFSVLIDTGSSDLWVAGTVPGAIGTNATAGVSYAVGGASGPVKTANLVVLGYTIPNQAYIEATPSSSNPAGQGVIGLGPNSVSQIFNALGGSRAGDAPISRIFQQNMSSPNFLTVLLGRSNDPAEQSFQSEWTIGEVISGYENVTSQPHVPVTLASNQHWQILLDSNGIVGPDGQPLNVSTGVPGTKNKAQLTAVFDTGFSLPQVPEAVADGIYSRFDGAQLTNIDSLGKVWVLPCATEVNVTIKFGNMTYPMHPLDTNMDFSLGMKDPQGRDLCVGSLQPISSAQSTAYDLILGMSWLRNAYMLINYGDFVDGTNNKALPYVQAISITDPSQAHLDFVNARLGGSDTTGTQPLLNATASPSSYPISIENDSPESWIAQHWVIIAIAAASTAGGLLLGALIYICLKRRARNSPAAYRTLGAPAPIPVGDMNYVQGYGQGRGHKSNVSLGAYPGPQPMHLRELSNASTVFDSDYDTVKYDPAKGSYNYPNPWDRPHATQ